MIPIKKNKILLACTHSLGAKFFSGQINYLNKAGFDVYVISSPGKEIEELCKRENAKLIKFGFKRTINPFFDLISVFKVRRVIKALRPDIVNTGTPKAGLIVVVAAKLANITPILFTLRGLRSETLNGLKGFIVKSMEKLTCSIADVVIPISPSLAKHAIDLKILNPNKSIVIAKGSSNGVNIGRYTKDKNLTRRDELRDGFNVSPSECLIGYVGRLNVDKGILELFEVFKNLNKERIKVKLMLVGKFEEEDAISEIVQNEILHHPNVIFVPYTEKIEEIYEVLDVLVLFSKREGFGNVLIEASAMEIPVIASDIPGCRDAVYNNHSGYLVKNVFDLDEKLRLYINSAELRLQHGKNGREWVENNFKSEHIWEEQVKLYNRLLAEKAREIN